MIGGGVVVLLVVVLVVYGLVGFWEDWTRYNELKELKGENWGEN